MKRMLILILAFSIINVIGCNINNEVITTENDDIINQKREIEQEAEVDITEENEQFSELIETELNETKDELQDTDVNKNIILKEHEDNSVDESKYEVNDEETEKNTDLTDNEIQDVVRGEKQQGISETVTLSIEGPKDMGQILETITVTIEDGDTVFDIIKRVTREKEIHLSSKGSGSRAYIEGIDNLYEFDKGPTSGWLYSVNDNYYSKGCGTYIVSDGDVIKWMYTLDLGKDLGALN